MGQQDVDIRERGEESEHTTALVGAQLEAGDAGRTPTVGRDVEVTPPGGDPLVVTTTVLLLHAGTRQHRRERAREAKHSLHLRVFAHGL